MTKHRFTVAARTCAAFLLMACVFGVGVAPALAAPPNMNVSAKDYPLDDGVVLKWVQHYTWEKDGTVRVRNHRIFKFLNRKPIRSEADPRVTYNLDEEELKIHTARTHLPDGEILDVPDYSFNPAGPDDVAGWPEYAGWRDVVISFSGIVAGCAIELDYEIVTKPGVYPWLEGDLCLTENDPAIEREIIVTVPDGVKLSAAVSNTDQFKAADESANGMKTYRWVFRDLPAMPGEPASLRWEERCPRLQFTTCPDAKTFVGRILKTVGDAAKSTDDIKKFAEEASKDAAGEADRARKVSKKIRDSFNFKDSARTYRGLRCRPAAEVWDTNYGNPLEAAAFLAASLSALDASPRLYLAVDEASWSNDVPTLSSFAGVVTEIETPDGALWLHPRVGEVRTPGAWGGHTLIALDDSGRLDKSYVAARGEGVDSMAEVSGMLKIDGEGRLSGDLSLRLTGAYYDPADLDSAGSQKGLVGRILGRVVSGADISNHAVTYLADDVMKAEATIRTGEAQKPQGDNLVVSLGSGPAVLLAAYLPVDRVTRRTAVDTGTRLHERIDVTIELPQGKRAAVAPASLEKVEGEWGYAEQCVELDGNKLRLRRNISINSETIAPSDFDSLRNALNKLQTETARMLVVAPK